MQGALMLLGMDTPHSQEKLLRMHSIWGGMQPYSLLNQSLLPGLLMLLVANWLSACLLSSCTESIRYWAFITKLA